MGEKPRAPPLARWRKRESPLPGYGEGLRANKNARRKAERSLFKNYTISIRIKQGGTSRLEFSN